MNYDRPVASARALTRRGFLRALAVGVAGAAITQAVPDVARTYILPPPAGWRSASGLVFHRDALSLTMPDLDAVRGLFNPPADIARQYREGLSLRVAHGFDAAQWPCRIDVVYGWATLRPELACRILGA